MSTTPNRSLLVIAYYFPPLGLSGVQRTLKFVKYLPSFGWQPTVLTVTPTGYFAQDYSLLDELLPLHIDIVRAGSLDPNRIFRKKGVVKMPSERVRKLLSFASDTFFIPDNKLGWKRKAIKAAGALFEKQHFDAVFSTAPPFTDFLIGAELARKYKRPLVLDYRDAWHDNPLKSYPTPLHRIWNKRLEKRALHASSRILTTNRRVKELILQRYRFLAYNDISILPQGFDPEDFAQTVQPRPPDGRMRITHSGVFYADRSPVRFLQGLKAALDRKPELRKSIEARFVGNFQDEYRLLVQAMGLEENVVITGYLEHLHCVRELMESDLLWFTLTDDTQSPGKVYEYLGARKPILACTRDGFVRQTVEEAGAAIVVDPDDPGKIADGIIAFHEKFKAGKLPRPDEEVVKRYDRVSLTFELSKILGFLVDTP
jgi:glycosyltransferase involved in cell wall biosynthesis